MFVSSTCYDLSQVRADLRDFLLSLGIEPVMSEFDTFPIDPAKDTRHEVLTCLKVYSSQRRMPPYKTAFRPSTSKLAVREPRWLYSVYAILCA
jgi:Domain of unknown function (DUF4062)